MGCAKNIWRIERKKTGIRIKANAFLIIPLSRAGKRRRSGAKKNTRENEDNGAGEFGVEYAVEIFHGSIMAIQSGREGGKGCPGNLSFRRRSERVRTRFIRKREPRRERRRPLECALYPFRWDPEPVFSFRFRATERKKVRPGSEGERGRCKRDSWICRTTGALRMREQGVIKGDQTGQLHNLWSDYT